MVQYKKSELHFLDKFGLLVLYILAMPATFFQIKPQLN